jgi:hypothetical protein
MFQIVTKPVYKWRLIHSELEKEFCWGTFHIIKVPYDHSIVIDIIVILSSIIALNRKIT